MSKGTLKAFFRLAVMIFQLQNRLTVQGRLYVQTQSFEFFDHAILLSFKLASPIHQQVCIEQTRFENF